MSKITKMKGYKRILLAAAVVLIFFSSTSAQLMLHDEKELSISASLPPIALVDVEPGMNNDLLFLVSPTTESGASPQIIRSNNEQLWLNYSSVVKDGTRFIDAQFVGGNLPDGVKLKIEASQYSGNGAGQMGQPTKEVVLSQAPQSIISDIGNCFTGNGVNNGHLLTFSIEVDDLSILAATNETVFTIVYTIRD